MTLFYETCPHRYWQRGFKQPRDLGMPERSWGSYLPGDESGWMCDIDDEGCGQEDCPYKERLREEGILEEVEE